MSAHFLIRPQSPDDNAAIEALHKLSFGPGRFARTAYRIREAVTRPLLISLTAWDSDVLVGAIQFTAITIGGARGAVLLGPLAIAPAYKNMGAGLCLMREGLTEAAALGCRLAVLVGDLPYYQRAGFGAIPPGQILMPGPVDPARLLAAELEAGALTAFIGMVAADNAEPFRRSTALAEPGQHYDPEKQPKGQETA